MMDDFTLGSGPKETPQNGGKTQPEATPPLKKTDLMIFVLSVIALLLIFAYTTTKHPSIETATIKNEPQQEGQQYINLTGLQIAEKSAEFLEDMKTNDGFYDNMKFCDTDKCERKGEDYRIQSTAWAVKAYVGLYKATSDERYLSKIKEGMDKVVDSCKKNAPDDENCKLILVQVSEAYDIIKDGRYLDMLKTYDENPPFVSKDVNTMVTAIVAHQNARLYALTGDRRFRQEADFDVYQADLGLPTWEDGVTIYSNYNLAFRNYGCWVQLSKLAVFESTGEVTYLQEAKRYFDEASLGEYAKTEGIHKLDNVELEPCIDALLRLSDHTRESKYGLEAELLSKKLIDERWDQPNAKKHNGDNGFLLHSCDITWNQSICYNDIKAISDTSYAIYLLSKQKDVVFLVTQSNEAEKLNNYLSGPTLPITKPKKEIDYGPYFALLLAAIIILTAYLYSMKKK